MAEEINIDNPDFTGLSGAGRAAGTDQLNLSDLQATMPSLDLPDMSPQLQDYLIKNQIGDYNKSPYALDINNTISANQQLASLINNVNVNGIGVDTDPFKMGKRAMFDARNPNIPNQFYERYAAHADFEELGFSPFRDNETLFNQNSSWFDEMGRAAGEWATLAGLGMKDAMGFGDLTDPIVAAQYEKAMAIGQSSKGGVGGFTTNLFLNSGYTVGIMGELALEELALLATEAALGLGTVGTGFTAAPATAPAMATVGATMVARATAAFAKVTKAFKNAANIGKTLDTFKDVNKAREYFTKAGKGIANFLNPAENTVDFFRNYDKLEGLENWKKASKGFIEFYGDVRNLRLAWGEGSLEGGMVENQMERDLLEEFRTNNGRMPDDAEAAEIKQIAKTAGLTTASLNVPLIMLSNKLTFDGLIRGRMRRTYASILTTKSGGKVLFNPKKGVEEAYSAIENGYKGLVKTYINQPSLVASNMLKYTKANWAEGLQELGQETLASASEDYYKAKFQGDLTKGGYYNYVLENLGGGHGVGVAAETFLSGFLMGGMIAPVSNTVAAAMRGRSGFEGTLAGRVGGVINEGAIRVFDIGRGQYKRATNGKVAQEEFMQERAQAAKERALTKAEKRIKNEKDTATDVEILNKMYADPQKYLQGNLENVLEQKEYQKMMGFAERTGDVKSFYDAKDSSVIANATTAAEYGQLGNMLKRIEELKSLSKEDVENDSSITSTYEEFQKDLDNAYNYTKQVERNWTEVNKKLPNPYTPAKFKKGTAMYNAEVYAHNAWNKGIKQIVFNQASFARTLARQKSLLANAQEVSGLASANYADLANIFNINQGYAEVALLNKEIAALETVEKLSPENKKELTKRKNKKLRLENVIKQLDNVAKNYGPNETLSKKDLKELEKAFTFYIKAIATESGDYVNNDKVKQLLQNLIDYQVLENRADAQNQAVNTLLDPDIFLANHVRITELNKILHQERKKEIEKSLKLFKKAMRKNKMLNELYDEGMFFNPKDLVALENEGKVPTTFYRHEDGNVAEVPRIDPKQDVSDYQKAVAIVEKYLEEEGIEIQDVDIAKDMDPYSSFSRMKNENDKRRYKDYAEQFGFDPEAAVSKVPLKQVLQAIIDSDYATDREKALAEHMLALAKDEEVVTFNNSEKVPGLHSTSRGVVINAQWSSYEFKQGKTGHPLEHVILHEEVHRRISEALETDKDFHGDMSSLLQRAKQAWSALSDTEKFGYTGNPNLMLYGLSNVDEFVAEAMSNDNFQKFLATIPLDKKERTSVWKKFVDLVMENIEKILGGRPNGTVLNAALEQITAKIEKTYGKPTEEAPAKETISVGPITKETTALEIQQGHPELAKDLVVAFREFQQQRKDDDQTYLTGFENMSEPEIIAAPAFTQFLKGTFSKKDRIIQEYNKSKAKEVKPNQKRATFDPDTINRVTDEEYADFKQTGEVTLRRILLLAKKKKNEEAFTDQEQEMYEAAVNENGDNLVEIEKTKGAFTIKGDDFKDRLEALGYKKTEIKKMGLPEGNALIQGAITKEQRDAEAAARATAVDPVIEEKRKRYVDSFEKALAAIKTYEDWEKADTIIFALFTDTDFTDITGITVEMIEEKLKEKLNEIAFTINFADIVVGETLMANDKKLSRLEVIGKGEDYITVTDKSNNKTFEIKAKDLEKKIKYRYSKALMNTELETTRQATEEEKAIMQETTEQAIGNENINEDLDNAKKSSKDELANDLLNNICK